MRQILCTVITVYLVVLFARAIASWLPPPRGGAGGVIVRLLFDVTEPVLAPLRRASPPAGMFDLSFIVLMFILFALRSVVCPGGM